MCVVLQFHRNSDAGKPEVEVQPFGGKGLVFQTNLAIRHCFVNAPRECVLEVRLRVKHWSIASQLVHKVSDIKHNRAISRSSHLDAVIKALLRHIDQPLLIVRDRLPAHRSRLVREFIELSEEPIVTEYLPPYAPELNPVE